MQAAGGPIDGFWALYKIHLSSETAPKLLAAMRIGKLKEGEKPTIAVLDEFKNEPERSPDLVVISPQPLNAETPQFALSDDFITPTDLFFVRGHFPVPDIEPAAYQLEISGHGVRPLMLSLNDLKTKFGPPVSICASIQCAGNRRADMSTEKATQGLQWGPGAVATAVWTGVKLRDVLRYAGLLEIKRGEAVEKPVMHVQFEGYDGYGGSIDINKAYDEEADVVLAWEMNGEPITRDHGAPVRVIVPGRVAARSVKFLKTIKVSDQESPALWQQKDYRIPPPYADPKTFDLSKAPPIQELPVQSAITSPEPENAVVGPNEKTLLLKGYAVSGARRRIVRVDVSIDGGDTWREAEIVDGKKWLAEDPEASKFSPEMRKAIWEGAQKGWCWSKWNLTVTREELEKVKKEKGEVEVVCKAVNSAWNVQPERVGCLDN